jgi:hypothetical protein
MFELYQVGLAFSLMLLGVIVWAGMSWRKRAKAQGLELVTPPYTDFSEQGISGYYVATTFADRPLDRVSGHGLGFAGKSNIEISDSGVQISRVGEKSFQIGKLSLLDLSRSSAVIDRAVEKDGLLSIRWKLGDTELESHFRFTSSRSRDQVAREVSNLLVGVK